MRHANVKLGLVVTMIAAGACNSPPRSNEVDRQSDDSAPENVASHEAGKQAPNEIASNTLERGQKQLERGGDTTAARAAFEAVLADPSATIDEQDEARLGLSQAREILGDKEGA